MPIADLVLWIGFLKWQLRTTEAKNLPEPILHAYGTIKHQDALLAYDSMEMLRDEDGKPLSRWDGETMKLHPITGEEIPDPDAKMELYQYVNPRRAEWPQPPDRSVPAFPSFCLASSSPFLLPFFLLAPSLSPCSLFSSLSRCARFISFAWY